MGAEGEGEEGLAETVTFRKKNRDLRNSGFCDSDSTVGICRRAEAVGWQFSLKKKELVKSKWWGFLPGVAQGGFFSDSPHGSH